MPISGVSTCALPYLLLRLTRKQTLFSYSQEIRIREWERERRMRIRQKQQEGAVNVPTFMKDTMKG